MEAAQFINYPGKIAKTISELIKLSPKLFLIIWAFIGICFCILLIFHLYAFFCKNQSLVKGVFSNFFFIIILITGVIILRLPNLILNELNVDESFWIANAGKVLNGAVIWKDVTGATGGPLIFAPLSIMYLLGDGINYTSIRIFGLLFCIVPSIICVFLLFKRLFNSDISSILIIPLIIFFAFANDSDILAYNSEHVPLILTALGILLLFSISNNNQINKPLLIIAGLLIGLFPFAKLQAMPIAFSITVCMLFEIFHSRGDNLSQRLKNGFLFLGAILIPPCILFLYLIQNNALSIFWDDYILQNLFYTSHGLGNVVKGLTRWTYIIKLIRATPDTFLLCSILTITALFSIVILIITKQTLMIIKKRQTIYLLLIAFSSYLAVSIPGNFFGHYQILFIIPFTILSGFLFGNMLMLNRSLLLAKPYLRICLFIIVTIPVTLMIPNKNRGIGFIKSGGGYQLNNVSTEIMKYAKPNEKMAIWGWASEFYVETGLIPGTMEAVPYYTITPSPKSYYYKLKYFEDLELNNPVIFLDAVAPNSFYFRNREKEGHENFKKIDNYIFKNYKLVAEIDLKRIYVLNTRLAEIKINPEKY